MFFRRAIQRYGHSGQPETPYSRAGQVWDERLGIASAQAHNWRRMAFGALLMSAGLSTALIWQSLQNRIVPYVVEVDKLGEAQAIQEAGTSFEPTDPQIAWHLARFIENVRSVSLDPVLMRRNWLSAYDFVTKRGSVFLDDYARRNPPFLHRDGQTVLIQVTSVVRASDQSFQIKWSETVFEQGSAARTSEWTAIATIVSKPPGTTDTLRKNPLGIYVDALAWSQELDATGRAKTKSDKDGPQKPFWQVVPPETNEANPQSQE
jgi:type IV secretory pathway TrbF-like protein